MTSLAARSSGLLVPPRWATPRDPSRKTLGAAVGRVATALGRPLMPWQQYVADVGGEVDPHTGLPVYSLCIVSVPRQSGKTTLDLAQSVQRCLAAPRRKVWHTAQTGQDARKKWRELADDIQSTPLGQLLDGRPRQSNGAEALIFRNGSNLRPHPPTKDALHGEQSDLNNIDEAWVFTEEQGADLFQAIEPTQATRPGAQTWIWSTRGDRASTWFHGLIDAARAGALPGCALFDWGIPEDVDPADRDAVADYHPAIGHTVTREFLRASSLPPGEFARAYGNRPTGAGERVLPVGPWDAARAAGDLPAGRPAYGVAVAGDGSAGAIVAAVLDGDGVPWVEVVEHRPGRSWLVDRVASLRDAGQGVAVDRRGPAAPVADQLELAGVELLPLTVSDYAAGCQDLYDRVLGGRFRHRDHPALDDAADIAARRIVGDGGWVWTRSKTAGDIACLEAATLAAWGVLRNPEPEPQPFVVFG